jgi:hypothetical protein
MNNVTERKYRIKELFDTVPHGQRAETIRAVCHQLEISYGQLRKIWGYKVNEKNEAKPSQLLAIANFFDVDIYDLLANVPADQKA